MYYHVGEWSRLIAGDYRHHPLVSIFTSALMIPLSLHTLHSILTSRRVHQPLLVVSSFTPIPLPPPASSHRAPYMMSCFFFFHAATEHSEFDSLVMYARRKIDSGSDMFSTGCLDGGSHFFLQIGYRQCGVPDRVLRYVVCVYVLIFEVQGGSSLSISICAFWSPSQFSSKTKEKGSHTPIVRSIM